MEEKKQKKEKKGINVQAVEIIMLILAIAMTVLVFFSLFATIRSFNTAETASQNYINGRQYTADLQEASDYLTEQARSFAVNGNIDNLNNYFTELNVTQRREKAVKYMSEKFGYLSEYIHLKSALDKSNALTAREFYSMRLAVDAYGFNIKEMPEEVRNTVLSDDDNALSDTEKRLLAIQYVFDAVYDNTKQTISNSTVLCVNALMSETQIIKDEAEEELLSMIKWESALVMILLLIIFVFLIITRSLIVRPIKQGMNAIKKNKHMPVKGAAELRFFAKTYNTIYDENNRKTELLSFEARHDPLTGLNNRMSFEEALLKIDRDNFAFLLIDIDNFKNVNDTYGHKMGDKVLCALADAMLTTFRAQDAVCRIGGDEFAVIVSGADESLKHIIIDKYNEIGHKLKTTDDTPENITISMGVAFGEKGEDYDTVFNNADKALYDVKNAGRNNIAFFEK